uniref:hypothetical protein n=1 Tax=Flavobacterium sp. TaxID=239 RepID=UPI00404B33FB
MKVEQYIRLYMILGLIEIIAEYFMFELLIIIVKPVLPILLLLAYYKYFTKTDWLFGAILITSALTNLIFIWINSFLIVGVAVFTIHRLLMIYFLIKILKIKDFIPVVLATLPFLMFSVFIFLDVAFQNKAVYFMIFFQNLMVTGLVGLALSQYILKDSFKITWLMLAVFLFFCLHFLVFIELFYVRYQFMRPLAMLLNIAAFYSFFRFVITNQKEQGEIINV